MCRFTFYLGPEIPVSKLVTEPEHSLVHQSYQAREREEPLNGDGFGLAWYNRRLSDQPAVFREVQPAWNSLNLLGLAQVSATTCLLAHVRAATPGLGVSQVNCHPFSAGRLAFMHNGEVGGFRETRRSLRESLSNDAYDLILGSTDSETAFSLIVDRLGDSRSKRTLTELADAVQWAIDRLESAAEAVESDDPAYLNFVLTDGEQAVVTRYVTPGYEEHAQSLYLHRGGRYRCEDGVCSMERTAAVNETLIVASEPLSTDPGWEAIEVNRMLLIDADHQVAEIRALHTERRLGAVA